jgi:hypothetical protein
MLEPDVGTLVLGLEDLSTSCSGWLDEAARAQNCAELTLSSHPHLDEHLAARLRVEVAYHAGIYKCASAVIDELERVHRRAELAGHLAPEA